MSSQKLCERTKRPLNLHSPTNLIHTASACSCSICDSITCFKLRDKSPVIACTCGTCKPAISCGKKCLLHVHERKKERPIYTKKEVKHVQKNNVQDSMKKQKASDNETNRNDNQCGNDINIKKLNNNEPFNNNKNELDTDKQSNATCKSKNSTEAKKNDGMMKYGDKQPTEVLSIALSYPKSDRDKSKTEVSAQIMNVPYEQLKDSLTIPTTYINSSIENSEKPSFNENKSVIPNIFEKLKEIYKVCSCKVCECIPTISLPTKDVCMCSPCNCDKCTNSQKIDIELTCAQCKRKFRKKAEEGTSCTCKACECEQCADKLSKICNCKPCQCAECTINDVSYNKSFLVAHIQENFRETTCRCEPCQCEHCKNDYLSMITKLRRDSSYKDCYFGTDRG